MVGNNEGTDRVSGRSADEAELRCLARHRTDTSRFWTISSPRSVALLAIWRCRGCGPVPRPRTLRPDLPKLNFSAESLAIPSVNHRVAHTASNCPEASTQSPQKPLLFPLTLIVLPRTTHAEFAVGPCRSRLLCRKRRPGMQPPL